MCHASLQHVSSSLPQSRVTASVPENLSLFLDPKPKTEEVKKLSKDSILSLYASTPSVHASSMAAHGESYADFFQLSHEAVYFKCCLLIADMFCSAGLYMNQMGYPTHPYGSYHSLAQVGGMGGTMMASQMAMMGQQQSGMMGVQPNSMMGVQQNGLMGAQSAVAQPSSVVPSPYMPGMIQGVMGQQQGGMMGQQQMGGLATLPHQQVYGVQQTQQLQWNISQVCVSINPQRALKTANAPSVTTCVLRLSDDSAHDWHESLQHQQRGGIRQPAHGCFNHTEFSTHDGARLEMMTHLYIMERQRFIN